MTVAAAHASAFYRDVAVTGIIWTIRDAGGFPTSNGAMPFWSSQSRTEKIISTVPAYADFSPVEIPVEDFLESWIPGLERDKLMVGINWSGARAMGYEVEPRTVATAIAVARGADV